jgi:hypothetical protein
MTRFLAPWFADKLRGVEDSRRAGLIRVLAKESQGTPFATPYWVEGDNVGMNESWQAFLMENMGVVQAFGEHHLALYLQARNPSVPGIVNKLGAPTNSQLTMARQFWRLVRAEFEKSGRAERFQDIYAERRLGESFAVDHFLPWSFVAHDLLWNLTPVEQTTNSSKSDRLPDLDVYLPRLAKLHFGAIEAVKQRPKLLEDYTDCFKLDCTGLIELGEKGLAARYREIIVPQVQIAINQGFQAGWRMSSPALIMLSEQHVQSLPNLPTAAKRGDDSEENTIEVEDAQSAPSSRHLPFYSLRIAAGGFVPGDAPLAEGWVDVAKHGFATRLIGGMFVTQVIGKSMEPTIRDGAFCVFRLPVVGSRQGRVVLVRKGDISDTETGGNFTVKRYRSTKRSDESGWRHERIELVPDNPDRKNYPVLRFTGKDHEDLRVIAEFIAMLEPQVSGDAKD